MTDPELAERLARLQQRRLGAPTRPVANTTGAAGPDPAPEAPAHRRRPKHPALGARIAAAGLGLSTTFGLLTSMVLTDRGSTSSTTAAQALPASAFPASVLPAAAAPARPPVVRLTSEVSARSAAIVPSQPAPAPATGSTHGSR